MGEKCAEAQTHRCQAAYESLKHKILQIDSGKKLYEYCQATADASPWRISHADHFASARRKGKLAR